MKEATVRDPVLAAFLMTRGVRLVRITPETGQTCFFVMESLPRELLDEFLLQFPAEKQAINHYRHLVRDARNILQDNVNRGGKR